MMILSRSVTDLAQALAPDFFRRAVAAALGSCLVLAAASGHADALTAEALFQSGREALEKGDVRAACDRFQESYRLDPTAGTALNLGNCRERLGQLATAWQRFEEAAQKLPDGDRRVALARADAADLEPKVPHLTLSAPPGATEFTVTRDGEQVGSASLGLALPVDPGAHVILVRANGHADFRREVTLTEGQQLTLALKLGPDAPAPAEAATAAAPHTPEPTAAPTRTAGWVFTGVGAAGIVTSLAAGAVVLSKKSTVHSDCVDKRCSDAGLDAAQSGRTFSTIGTVAFGVGAAALGVGLYLVLSPPHGAEHAGVGSAATRFGASTTRDGVQLSLESAF